MHAHRESPREESIILAERRSLLRMYLSPIGVLFVVVTVLTCGLFVLILVLVRLRMPTRVWLDGERLHADRTLPPHGIRARDLSVRLGVVEHSFIPLVRFVEVFRTGEESKRPLIGVNGAHFGKEAPRRVSEALLERGAHRL